MDWFLTVFLWFLIAVYCVVLGRALVTGRLGFGAHAVLRTDDPARFWIEAAMSVAAAAMLVHILLRDPVNGVPRYDDAGWSNFMLAAMLAFLLVRFLLRGTASAGGTPFSRKEEPTQYWIIIALTVAALGVVTWFALRVALSA
jgi:hypothetical protein